LEKNSIIFGGGGGKRHIQTTGPAAFSLITSSSLVPITHRVSNFPNTAFTFYENTYIIDEGYIYKTNTNRVSKPTEVH